MSKSPHMPTVLVVFGATGDLMFKKIVPSLYFLYKDDQLPEYFKVVGFSRRHLNEAKFRKHIFQILKDKEMSDKIDSKMSEFLSLFHFQKGNFDNIDDFKSLKQKIKNIDDDWKICSNKLFYLAVPPNSMGGIVKNLQETGLSDPCGGDQGWARIMLEKPFGNDGKSAKELEKTLSGFKQEQIYRIDHYLGKEMVQGILNFRFSNNLLEHNWSNQHIEKIEMKLMEEIGVEDRGPFYESVGALKDVGQNHLLAILGLLTMDRPVSMDAQSVVDERGKALQYLRKPKRPDIHKTTFRAQYDGYRKIKGVDKKSKVETYFKVVTELENERWRGVPIIIESGKRMKNLQKEIIVTFKHSKPCLCNAAQHPQNKVVFSLHPKQGITIEFLAKEPGFKTNIERRTFDFLLYKEKTSIQYVEEYAKLFLDCFDGNQTWFSSKEEIEAMWNFVDPILEAWSSDVVELNTYKKNTTNMVEETNYLLEKYKTKENFDHSLAIVGLGKMGGNLALNLFEKGWDVVGFNRSPEVTKKFEKEGVRGAYSIKEMADKLTAKPKIVWLMLPAGEAIDSVLFDKDGLLDNLKKGDIIIDGGNSFYKDTIRRYEKIKATGIHYFDCGVSGGPGGARNGACLMVGGDKKVFEKLEPLFAAASKEGSYQFFEGVGAGHFVKMIHNGIEYGMMQAVGEGFEILKKAKYDLDLSKVAEIYNNGSVIESRLVGWLKEAFELYGTDLEEISGRVHHSGEGEWTVKTAKEMGVKDKIIAESYKFRLDSQKHPSYTGKVVSALRGRFGRHDVEKKKNKK